MRDNKEDLNWFENQLSDYSTTSRATLKKANGWGVAVGSVATLAVCTSESEAAIAITNLNAPFGPSTTVLFDVDGDSSDDFEFQGDDDLIYPFSRLGALNGAQIVGRSVVTTFTANYASRLGTGVGVGPTLSFLPVGSTINKLLAFTYSGTSSGGDWLGGATGFVGFRVPDGGGGDFRYGWIEVTVNADNISGTVIRYGIEDTVNTAAVTGAAPPSSPIPEPNSLACLAVGAAGLLSWRQRRKAA